MLAKQFSHNLVSFVGVVEDLGDPLKLGRCRVRVFNYHGEDIETDQLDWATQIQSSSASLKGVGISPTWLLKGTIVIGIYLDGDQRTMPMIIGSIATIPENDEEQHGVNKLARGEVDKETEKVGSEPSRENKREYPHNKVISTLAGHVIELDDTPGAERVNIQHSAGSYIEINKDGRMVIKAAGDSYNITAKDETAHTAGKSKKTVKGNCTIEVDGTMTLKSKGTCLIQSTGNVNIKGAKVNLQ